MNKCKTILMLLACLLMLLGLARAIPSGTILEDAQMRYMEETTDDEYDFL